MIRDRKPVVAGHMHVLGREIPVLRRPGSWDPFLQKLIAAHRKVSCDRRKAVCAGKKVSAGHFHVIGGGIHRIRDLLPAARQHTSATTPAALQSTIHHTLVERIQFHMARVSDHSP